MKRLMKEMPLPNKISYFLLLICRRKTPDQNGLYWDVSLLKSIKPTLPSMPLEMLAKFADDTCIQMCNNLTVNPVTDLPRIMRFNHVNTTAIGNIAYLAMYYPIDFIKDHCRELLANCFTPEYAN